MFIYMFWFSFSVPAYIYRVSEDITVNEGSNVTLSCLANGRPDPSITWRLLNPSGEWRINQKPLSDRCQTQFSHKFGHVSLTEGVAWMTNQISPSKLIK